MAVFPSRCRNTLVFIKLLTAPLHCTSCLLFLILETCFLFDFTAFCNHTSYVFLSLVVLAVCVDLFNSSSFFLIVFV